jgi:endonuclease/exonuclease/phosphatase family metal-dependent hydrolase
VSSAEPVAATWLLPDLVDHRTKLDAACQRIGPVVMVSPEWPDAARSAPPPDERPAPLVAPDTLHPLTDIDRIVIVSWNTYLGRGDLDALVAELGSGAFTEGTAPEAFVLLLQEVYRSEILAFARQRQLHVVYAPARLRQGDDDERGLAILSTFHPDDILVVELPYEKQRRIGLGATLAQRRADGSEWEMRVVNTHFDTAVGIFRGGPVAVRRRQARALMQALAVWPPPIVIGGDLNTWWGEDEPAVKELRRAFPDAEKVRARATWRWPLWIRTKLDYVFAKGTTGPVRVRRLDKRFGSDHWPLVAVVLLRSR